MWNTLREDVALFIMCCIHCLSTQGKKASRPFGETLRATKPNEILHFDFLSLPRNVTGNQYAQVLKDNMSGYVELIKCNRPNSESAYYGMIDWFKRFRVAHTCMSA
ncbi:Retrotransposon protein [Phytophthora megakarya]|uniref:Retrotransposon protein n=1 Tax=Phytophthora megakarya TaxID=4795 RepID=A0A225VTD2_9STRA|nr:Retrotransposon protein [Phytophthora megakarya]